ncbi:MAG TPA: PLP-dependent aminotransferase family protein [Blastocatellia bacterium]|nr:PLP-dependent aminotransferase family protein [Blastocatellia bacterium]
MILELQRDSRVPLYSQIVTEVRRMITAGALKVGDRLPANRELARTLGVNRNTVSTAYAELVADGLITSRVGSGTYVSSVPAPEAKQARGESLSSPMPWEALLAERGRDNWLHEMAGFYEQREMISLSLALPSADLFPLDDFRRCVDHVLRKQGRTLLQLGTTGGYPRLQEFIASQLALTGARVTPDEVLITNGCQQSLDLIRQILVGQGDEVALESPTYPGALSVFCGAGSKYISVPVSEKGIDLDVLEDVLSQRRAKLIYVVPSFQNPTGCTMDHVSRRRLIGIASRFRIPIVEDDIYRELRYDGPAIPPLKALDEHGLVIYISSFSKVGFPGLRVGWIAAPRIVIDHLNRVKQRCDLHASLLAQAAIHEFAKRGLLARHIKRVKKAYAERRDAMLGALERHFPDLTRWSRPNGGMSVWVSLPDSINANQLLHQAVEGGVSFISGDHFYASSPSQNSMRLSFTMAGPEAIEEAVKRLGLMIKARLARIRRAQTPKRVDSMRALV